MIDKALFLVYNIIVVMSEDITGYMQTYRSGHNGADSKSVCGQPHVSSNLTVSTTRQGLKLFFASGLFYSRKAAFASRETQGVYACGRRLDYQFFA